MFPPAELAEEQIGYSVTPDGRSLVGEAVGDWRQEWLVVAREDLTGDPFFVDLNEESLPVFSAMHGEGSWDPSPVSDSLTGFQAALAEVHAVSPGREHPVGLERNPLPMPEVTATLARIEKHTGQPDIREFWRWWLAPD